MVEGERKGNWVDLGGSGALPRKNFVTIPPFRFAWKASMNIPTDVNVLFCKSEYDQCKLNNILASQESEFLVSGFLENHTCTKYQTHLFHIQK